ncbi:F0F1 ATP synthase subunit A [Leptolyngbya sp. 15MV]|nr:F0F1 ATP synthase subunit A [Leptolyngbya sp. 15MV]
MPIAQALQIANWIAEGKPVWYKEHTLPVGGTATGNIWVTAALAIMAGIVFNVAAIRGLGVGGFVKHLTGGAPTGVNLIVALIEGLGQFFIKPAALMVRLFANMTAGSLLIGTLLIFTNMAFEAVGGVLATGISLVAILSAIALTFLKIFVSFLQAFVFMFLVTIFIGLMSHHGDEHGHHGEEGHEHAPAH